MYPITFALLVFANLNLVLLIKVLLIKKVCRAYAVVTHDERRTPIMPYDVMTKWSHEVT